MHRLAEVVVARRAMACEFSVRLPAAVAHAVDLACEALDEVERLEGKLSAYREESDISRVNREAAGGPVIVDAEIYSLLGAAARLSAWTRGAFDPASGALVKAWGFYRGPRRVPSDAEREEALANSGGRHLWFHDAERTIRFDRPGVEINLGAIGKGYAIDRAIRKGPALMQGGQSSLKAIGGWWVQVGDPAIARIWLRDRAMGTSAADNQFFEADGRRYGHVLDPRTGWPACGVISASAIAPTAMEADALSTAFFVMGLEETRRFCAEHPRFGAVMAVPGRPPQLIGAVEGEVAR